jgi:hypothetical protein
MEKGRYGPRIVFFKDLGVEKGFQTALKRDFAVFGLRYGYLKDREYIVCRRSLIELLF